MGIAVAVTQCPCATGIVDTSYLEGPEWKRVYVVSKDDLRAPFAEGSF